MKEDIPIWALLIGAAYVVLDTYKVYIGFAAVAAILILL